MLRVLFGLFLLALAAGLGGPAGVLLGLLAIGGVLWLINALLTPSR